MNIIQQAFGSTTILLSVLAFLAPCYAGSTAPRQLLYVQEGKSLLSYSVSRTTGVATKLGSVRLAASPSYPIQIFHAPTAPYLYVLGFTAANKEYFWVYGTTSGGVPASHPIQELSVKPALAQFFIHPNGKCMPCIPGFLDIGPT
jgi:hypothetical protein